MTATHKPIENVNDIVYMPNEAHTFALEEAKRRRETRDQGISSGIPLVDRWMLPLRPGSLTSVIGLAGNFKTGLMMYLARRAESVLDERVKQTGEARGMVIYVTWEQAIEEHALMEQAAAAGLDAFKVARGDITDEEFNRLRAAAARRSGGAIILIGHSLQHRRRRPHLTIEDVGRAMVMLDEELQIKPELIVLDYLQRIESIGDTGYRDRRIEQMHAVDRAKDMALAMACPVILGVQAKQEVADRLVCLPGLYDAQETSNVAQTSDTVLSVWMPKTKYQPGEAFVMGQQSIQVTDNLLILSLAKQKFGPSNKVFKLHVDPGVNKITAIDSAVDSR